MEKVKDLDEFFELYNRFKIQTGLNLTYFVVFQDKMLGIFLYRIRNGQIKTTTEERNKLLELGLLTEEHILKLDGIIPRRKIRKPGTAAKEIIIILREISRFADITNLPNGTKISDLLGEKQIEKIQKKTGLEFDYDTDIKRNINYLKFGGIPTSDKQRQELKELGVMADKHIKKLEGKIAKRKKPEKSKSTVEKDNTEKRKTSPRNSVPEKIMKILTALDEMWIDVAEIRQSNSLKDIVNKKGLETLKQTTGIEDISLDFRIGMYISNIRQGHIKTDKSQRELLKKLGVLNRDHIFKLEKRDKLSAELVSVLAEIEAFDIEIEEIKNTLARIKAEEERLKKELNIAEEKGENAKKKLQELNSKANKDKVH